MRKRQPLSEECKRKIGNAVRKHGMCYTPEYRTWQDMLNRCSKPNRDSYKYYGGRGIKVCERWHKFENFIADMGRRPHGQYSIDRYPNNNGNYEPGNCRWATYRQQTRNRRSTEWITFGGKSQLLVDWAKDLGIKQHCLRRRINRGWPLGLALTTPKWSRLVSTLRKNAKFKETAAGVTG